MNRLLLSIAATAISMTVSAQYILVNSELPIPASEVEKITYEQDDQFENLLLPGQLASDQKITIFTQALKLTGLADTLKAYVCTNPDDPSKDQKYYYSSHTHSEVAWPFQRKFKEFTVFAETDEAFAKLGITNLEQLKAYAKQVYDEVFPEDAGVTDPKDRRNSLNRFMAYHILKHKSTYWYLTAYDGTSDGTFFQNTNLADIAAWYGTLLPHASLKCSYPMGSEKGVYLNHRGLMSQPDKYGKQVRGAKVIADGERGFDHECFNGCYFHIDRVLAYDKTTREEVLGSELWRVDFKTLTPEIMSCAKDLRGNYMADDNYIDDSPFPANGKNMYFKWDRMENVKGDTARNNAGLVHRRAHLYYWSWQGDEVNVFGDYDMTIKLPSVPAGEWEVRMGICGLETRGAARIYLNDKLMIDTLDMRRNYYGVDIPFGIHPMQTEILDYMAEHYFAVEYDSLNIQYLVTDLKTGEKMLMGRDPYGKRKNNSWSETYTYNGVLAQENIKYFFGTNPSTEESVDWTQRAYEYREQAIINVVSKYPKCLRGPRECLCGRGQSFAEVDGIARYILGHISTDGKSDNYLRLQSLPSLEGNVNESMFDYFELVPKFIYDNQEIPEE